MTNITTTKTISMHMWFEPPCSIIAPIFFNVPPNKPPVLSKSEPMVSRNLFWLTTSPWIFVVSYTRNVVRLIDKYRVVRTGRSMNSTIQYPTCFNCVICKDKWSICSLFWSSSKFLDCSALLSSFLLWPCLLPANNDSLDLFIRECINQTWERMILVNWRVVAWDRGTISLPFEVVFLDCQFSSRNGWNMTIYKYR